MSTWTCLADELSLEGEALLFAADEREPALVQRSQAAGYRVVEVDTAGVTDFRVAQARIAAVLRLPESAGRNLDALADSLGDLARYWPDDARIALFWRHPEKLIERDTAGWFRLADVLQDATQRLWRGGNDPADRLFETVLLVPGFDA
ncbi:MAG TPA: barstar family protein [Micropruina sp.]|nr:barstar family protein [Micropruina sp.]